MQPYIIDAIQAHGLPPVFQQTVEQWYLPLAQKIAKLAETKGSTLVVGVQGTQGSGKSTLADFLRLIFEHQYHLNCAVLSIDDFYLTHAERQTLAKSVHPLLATRGVPGTHDLDLAISTLTQLKALTANHTMPIVRFDKAVDDRAPQAQWPSVTGPVNIIILEGWCVGLTAQPDTALTAPINTLEAVDDADGLWRHYVNQQLANSYPALFQQLDCLAVLKAPSFDCVFQWRLLQEQKLEQKWQTLPAEQQADCKILSPTEVERFIAHYQRLTEHALDTLPAQADWTLNLNADHAITALAEKETV